MINTLNGYLNKLNEQTVQVDLKSAITVPLIFDNFECIDVGDKIYFGELDSEHYPFQIKKNTIKGFQIECENEFEMLQIKIEDDGFTTYLNIVTY
jgi:hypothetical protein